MINNPDGSKRIPTKEEVLEHVRQQRIRKNLERTTIVSKHNSRSSELAEDIGGNFDDERQSTSSTNSGGTGFTQSSNGSNGRTTDTAGSTDRVVTGNNGSTYQYSVRDTADGDTTTRDYGTIRPIKNKSKFAPYREAIKEAFTKKKPEEKKTTSGTKGKPLTDQEARQHREGLIEVILWQSEHMDNLIQATTKGHLPVICWSDIDKDDATTIADFMLEEGKKSARAANLVRNMVELRRKIQVGLITIPRAYRMLQIYFERGIGIR